MKSYLNLPAFDYKKAYIGQRLWYLYGFDRDNGVGCVVKHIVHGIPIVDFGPGKTREWPRGPGSIRPEHSRDWELQQSSGYKFRVMYTSTVDVVTNYLLDRCTTEDALAQLNHV